MPGLLFALLSAFSFGISNVYWKKASGQDTFARIVFYRGVIASSCFGLAWLIAAKLKVQQEMLWQSTATPAQYAQTIALCLVCSLGLIFFLSSLNYSQVSISVPLSSINVFGISTAVWVLGEAFKTVYWFSLLMVILGVCLVQAYRPGREGWQWNRGATYAVMAAFFWGTTYALFKYPAGWMGALPLAFMLEISVTCSALIWMRLTKTPVGHANALLRKQSFRHYLVLAALLIGGTLFYNLAIQRAAVLMLNITGHFTTVTSVVLGVLLFREKLRPLQVVGILCLMASIVMVQIWG